MEFADLAFGERHDRRPGESHSLKEARDILLVTADAIEGSA